MKRYFRFVVMGIMLICISIITVGCGGGDSIPTPEYSGPPTPSSVEGSSWDSMAWDQGEWG